MSALLDAAIAQIGRLHDGPDVPRMAREIGGQFPRLAPYCATADGTTAWCGIFIAWLLAKQGIEPPYAGIDNVGSFFYVDSWAKIDWGGTHIQRGQEQPGDIIPMNPPHHVSILKEVRGDRYICVGGNQTGPSGNPDSVTEASYPRSSAMAIVRPPLSAQVSTEPPKPAVPFVPLDPATIDDITRAAAASDLARYTWKDRGRAPVGYIKGMAATYGQALRKLAAQDSAAVAMVRFVDASGDVFDHYENQFLAAGIVTANAPAVDRLRALWTVLTGLGMRESSGNYSEGRDMSASNVQSDTAEAGAFQMSWNANTTSPEIGKLLDGWPKSDDGFLSIFREGVRVKDTDNFGSGDGLIFQVMAKSIPAFAAETAAIGLRTLYTHWGPIVRKEAEVRPEADALFRQVEQIVGAVPVVVAPPIVPQPAPTSPGESTMDDKFRIALITEIVKAAPNTKTLQLLLLDSPSVSVPATPSAPVPAPTAPAQSGNVLQNLLYGLAGSLVSGLLGGAGVIGTPIGPDATTTGLVTTILPIITGLLGLNVPAVNMVLPKPKA